MKTVFQICLLIVLSLTASEIAYACVCIPGEHKKEIEKTDVIFTGRVIEITQDTSYVPIIKNVLPGSPPVDTEKRYFVKFKVETNFKGFSDGEITLVQYQGGKPAPCAGISFTKGNKYLVYAGKRAGLLMSGGCSRTRFFNKKSRDYKELLEYRPESKNKMFS